jgi:hypothetical protein
VLHVTVFPAFVKAAPATAEIEFAPAAGYCIVHCKAATDVAPDVNVRLSEMGPGDDIAPDERLSVCADTGAVWARITTEAIAKNLKKDTALLFRPAGKVLPAMR